MTEVGNEGQERDGAAGRSLVLFRAGPEHASATVADARHQTHCAGRPSVPFLAHLIGTAQNAPQLRARCRIDPADASTVYRTTADRAVVGHRHRGSL